MNTYDAIMMAAARIEQNPDTYSFLRILVPPECGTTGCMLGWIGVFAGYRAGTMIRDVSRNVLGVNESEFYRRLKQIGIGRARNAAHIRAKNVPRVLRRYAAKYHKPAQTFESFLSGVMTKVNGERIAEDAL